MLTLLIILVPIALLDSLSIVPLCLVPLAVIFASDKPLRSSIGIIGGVWVVYVVGGILLLVGLEALMHSIRPAVSRWWTNPNTLELILQLMVGIAMLGYAWRLRTKGDEKRATRAVDLVSPGHAFVIGAGIVVVSLPGALPYFGAIDRILRQDLTQTGNLIAILFYSSVFVLPLVFLVFVRVVLPAYSDHVFGNISGIFNKYGGRVFIYALLSLGIVLAADAVGWFFGLPLIPVG